MSMWQPYQFGVKSGPVWTELRPAGDVDRNWNCVSIDGNKILIGELDGRLWYFNGSSWSEQQPYGYAVDIDWLHVCVAGNEMVASDFSGRFWHYSGGSWSLISNGAPYLISCSISSTGERMWGAYYFGAGGRLYTENGIFTEQQPAGDANKNWLLVAQSGNNMMAGVTNERIYSYLGSWSEQQPAGNADKNWADLDISGSKMVSAVLGGRLYYYSGGWSEQQPDGNADKYWWDVSISGSRMAVVRKGSTATAAGLARTFYFDGTFWTDPEPTGDVDESWNCIDIYSNVIVAGIYDGRLYKGVM